MAVVSYLKVCGWLWHAFGTPVKRNNCRPGHFRCTNPNDCLHFGFSNRAGIKFSDVSVERTASLFKVTKLDQLNSTAMQMVGWTGECWIENDVKGKGRALVDVLSRNLHGGTEEHHKSPVNTERLIAEIWNRVFRKRNKSVTNTGTLNVKYLREIVSTFGQNTKHRRSKFASLSQ